MPSDSDKKKNAATLSGFPLKDYYTRQDLEGLGLDSAPETPGRYPFTRGIHPEMYRERLWTMRQYAGFGTARESNRRFRFLLAQGQTGLSVAFDLPTQVGLDSDDPRAHGEVGRVGVAIDSIQDMADLLRGIPLDRVSVSMTINATAAVLLAMVLALAEESAVPWDKLSGTIQNDILKEYIARGTYIFPPEPSLRIITDILAFCQARLPRWNTMSISGYHIREAGATAVQELAFTLANAVAYVRAALAAGLDIDTFAPRLSFFFAAQNDLFEEVAKFRAARQVWAKLMREKFRAKDPQSWKLRFHTQTSGAALQALEPENNVVRVALQALAAVLGGTQSLHTNSRDEALALPSEESVRIALRTQQIIAHESGVAAASDPLGGSYLVERLTAEIVAAVETLMAKVEDLGGALRAIESGFVQRKIQDSAYAFQKQVESGERVIVGLNRFAGSAPKKLIQPSSFSPRMERAQRERLRRLKSRRNRRQAGARIEEVREAARSSANLMPSLIAAVKAQATLGEIVDALKSVFGVYKENVVL